MEYIESSGQALWGNSNPLKSSLAQLLTAISWSPKIALEIDRGPYKIKTATTVNELLQCFKLRYQCFFGESVSKAFIPLDYDRYDLYYDHIIIEDKKSQKIIGTYRVHCSDNYQDFYSHEEFDLRDFFNLPGKKLELGRASIHKDFRNGASIDALWKGVVEYLKQADAQFLFGCSSIMKMGDTRMSHLYACLKKQNYFDHALNITVHPKYKKEIAPLEIPHEAERAIIKENLPSLLRSYLTAGAKIAGSPAYDMAFDCFDVFTYLNRDQVTPSFYKRYFA